MTDLSFKEWIKFCETGTSTASVAGFSRISIPMVRRITLEKIGGESNEDPFFKKRKKKKRRKTEED